MPGTRTTQPNQALGPTNANDARKSDSEPAPGLTCNTNRTSLVLERQMSELNDSFEEYRCDNNQRHQDTTETLAAILAAISRLESAPVEADRTPTPTPLMPSVSSSRVPLSNPAPTPELVEIVSRVVAEHRNCICNKKSSPENNSYKEHAHNTLYRLINISAARDIKPYFEDAYGNPDTLPAQFIDPNTGYCQPFPYWKGSLIKQVAWIPTFIQCFRTILPLEQPELAKQLSSLSDEAIVILLHKGPFKTCATAWRDAKRSDAEIKQMRLAARRYQRSDRKASARAVYIKAIASLQTPDFEYLYHLGYVPQDESDDDGVLVTKHPDNRAQWETNLVEAIDTAGHQKFQARPSYSRRRVEIVKRPIPHLERGTGATKVTVRIAICGISKSWIKAFPKEFKKYSPYVNSSANVKPDISAFLEQYPAHCANDDLAENTKDQQVVQETGVGNDRADSPKLYAGFDYDGDEESGAILDLLSQGYESGQVGGADELLGVGEEESTGASSKDIPIDPALLALEADTSDNLSGKDFRPTALLGSVKGKKRTAATSTGKPAVTPNGTLPPKRRGRPPGSKNKRKAVQVDVVNDGDDKGDE
ncbi:hypothetical protein RhiJN_19951 [Ceratobasidium sp. AG-Ba]|nr:hypothetical protein RhiJN_19951 [Ceratobasidium sp. AG-Ba]